MGDIALVKGQGFNMRGAHYRLRDETLAETRTYFSIQCEVGVIARHGRMVQVSPGALNRKTGSRDFFE